MVKRSLVLFFLSSFHPIIHEWSVIRTIKEADQHHLSIKDSVPLAGTSGTTLVLLINPVGRHAHIASRRFRQFTGNRAEIKMLLAARH